MPRKTVAAIQNFRGTTAQHNTYTGPAGELTVDTTKKTVVVQDGSTMGGNPVALEKRKIVSSASFLKVNGAASGALAKDNTLSWDMDAFIPAATSQMVDDKTVGVNSESKLVAKDVAIGGNEADLASARGQIGNPRVLEGPTDLNTLTTDGIYSARINGVTNAPMDDQAIVVVRSRKVLDSTSAITQTFIGTRGRVFLRFIKDKEESPAWSTWSELFQSARVGDGIRVTNGVPSVPEYQGATATASGVAGLLPPATKDESEYVLFGDGTWRPITNGLGDLGLPGMVVAFSGQFGGPGNRYPIPEDTGVPDLNWVLCDGVETDGVAVPDLRDRFIIGAGSSHAAGTSGGSFTTEGHTLTVNELAVHRHDFTSGGDETSSGASSTIGAFQFNSNTFDTGGSQPHTHAFKPPYYALAFIKQIHRRQSVDVLPSVNYVRDELFTADRTSITIPQYTQVRIGSKGYTNMSPVTLQLASVATAANRKGRDVYLYACAPTSGIEPVFVLSMNSTVPTGYTAENSRKIGGFHCLCANVGTIADHMLSGFVAGDILPASVWDLRHRAFSENEGMVYDPRLHLWVDIYLASFDAARNNVVSVYNGNVITGTTPSDRALMGESFVDFLCMAQKRLPWRFEFQMFAVSSNTNTNILGGTVPETTGGHVDMANRRIISYIGVEDTCGVFWQWTNDLFEGGTYGTIGNNQQWLNGYSWNMGINNSVGGDGSAYGFLRRALVGGRWDGGSYCGRRCVHLADASADAASVISARGVSEPRVWGAD